MRSLDQNAIMHVWFREISEHLMSGGVRVSEKMIKEMCKVLLGNTTDVLGVEVAVPTEAYKMAEHELTPSDIKNDFISMDQFLTKIQAWAATDIRLELVSPNEEKV
jgi:hypothetical protein